MDKQKSIAHISAFTTIIVWGTTFIATKILLESFQPIEVLVIRFVIGYLGLALYDLLVTRKKGVAKVKTSLKEEALFALAGASGVLMYYMLENFALMFTYASNVGILVSLAPLTTALLAFIFIKEEPLRINFIVGFVIATFGAFFVMFNGQINLKLSIKGDILALLATFGWAIYSITLKKIGSTQLPVTTYTRKIFFWGILFMIPGAIVTNFSLHLNSFTLINTLLIAFLGLGASATCFVSWNYAVKILGVLKTSAYIYLTPLVSLFTAALILGEKVTLMAFIGCLMILAGLYLSEGKIGQRFKIKGS
jgi:drug/metabolite transporter (DMT)-like permease